MTRSLWKPWYIHPQIKENISSNEIFLQSRATILTSNMIDRKFQIYNGVRWFPVEVTQERVGHRVGEFVPTRKRPVHKKKTVKKVKK